MAEKNYPRKLAAKLGEVDLRVNGFSYQMDFHQLEARLGKEAEKFVLEQALNGLEDLSRIDQDGDYLVWMLQRGLVGKDNTPALGLLVIISPATEELFKGNPIESRLTKFPEFIRRQGITPLYEGAVPFFQLSKGQIFYLDRDVEFLQQASRVLDKIMEETKNWEANIYRETLRELEKQNG
ncbi:MAG: hypothetical protein ACOYI2_01365 [Bacillota bacterium]|jgi:hypothetical protein|nr:hypothetical protein [Clostridia bacterium]